jgi:hypothetical protein
MPRAYLASVAERSRVVEWRRGIGPPTRAGPGWRSRAPPRDEATLVDWLLHSELIAIEGTSYRLREATERAAVKAKTRSAERKA